MSHGTQNGGLPNWARFVIGAAVVLVVIFVAPWLWRQYEDTGAQSERIAELKDDKARLESQLTAAQSELSELRLELRLLQQAPTTPLEPLPDTWPPPTTLDATRPDNASRLTEFAAELAATQAAIEQIKESLGNNQGTAADPAFVELRESVDSLRADVRAIDRWAHKVRTEMHGWAQWIVELARLQGRTAGKAVEPRVPADYHTGPVTSQLEH